MSERVRTGGLSVATNVNKSSQKTNERPSGSGSIGSEHSQSAGLSSVMKAAATGISLEAIEVQSARLKLDELFFVWMSQEDTQKVVRQMAKIHADGESVLKAMSGLSPSKNTFGLLNVASGDPPGSPEHRGNIHSSSPSSPPPSFGAKSPPLSPRSSKRKGVKEKLPSSPLRSPRSPSKQIPSTSTSVTSPVRTVKQNSKQSSESLSVSSATNTMKDFSLDDKHVNKSQDEDRSSESQDSLPPSAPSSPPTTVAKVGTSNDKPCAPSSKQLPKFFFPGEGGRGRGQPVQQDSLKERSEEISSQFKEFSQGMSHENFVAVTKDLCNLPSFFSTPLHKRVRILWLEKLKEDMKSNNVEKVGEDEKNDNADREGVFKALMSEEGLVTEEMFRYFWSREIEPFDRCDRFFRLIKRPERQFIFPSDFDPFLRELLKYHPGLEFLESAPEFQDKYMRTVTARIFYSSDTFERWRLSARDVRRSNPSLLEAFDAVDENDDINTVHEFFSYEHFYVLYCKFWELDTDRDFMLSRDDLLRYGGHALTRRTIDRVFEQAGRQFLCTTNGKMGFEDFVFFMLAEEDKTTLPAIRYWFNVVDLDSDGVIRPHEMRAFYDEQLHRMECLGHELVTFDDIYAQMCDLVGLRPIITGGTYDEFRLKDFTKHGRDHMMMCGNFFNMLFNLNKFVAFEQRDPFLLKQQHSENGQPLTLWARFAAIEYARLAMEEEMREQEQAQSSFDGATGWSN